MRIIAIANQKGGCGKTTTAINLASSLSSKGKRVLLIDCDPQAHATMGVNISPAELEKSMYQVMTSIETERVGLEEIIVPVRDGFDLAPSSVILSAVEQELSGKEGREGKLWQAINSLRRPYGYIIIDCPPSIGLLCFNALRACEEAIIPIDMSLFSLRGVAKLMEIIILLKDKLGHTITARALITMYDYRTRYARQVLEKVREEFGENVFETVIRYTIRLRETVDYGVPIGVYDKHSIGNQDYERLAEEIMREEGVRSVENYSLQSNAHDVLHRAEKYIEGVKEFPLVETLNCNSDYSSSRSYKSLYPDMVEAIALETAAIQSDDGGGSEHTG